MVFVGSAVAAHCPPGQFYRVRLKLCVGVNTSLALAYVQVASARMPAAEPDAGPVGKPVHSRGDPLGRAMVSDVSRQLP
jgi:hypothetical protein